MKFGQSNQIYYFLMNIFNNGRHYFNFVKLIVKIASGQAVITEYFANFE